jgi:hypothetical protein
LTIDRSVRQAPIPRQEKRMVWVIGFVAALGFVAWLALDARYGQHP